MPATLCSERPAAQKPLHDDLARWSGDNTLTVIHHLLFMQCREMMQRKTSPTAYAIDSQTVSSTEKSRS
jgi:hypothetical protein